MPALSHYGGQVPLLQPLPSSASTASSACFPSTAPTVLDTPHVPGDVPIVNLDNLESARELHLDVSLEAEKAGSISAPSVELIEAPTDRELQMGKGKGKKRLAITAVSSVLSLFTVSQLYQHSHSTSSSEGREEASWIASSHSWLDRKACEWFGICGLAHLNKSKWTWSHTERRKYQIPLGPGNTEVSFREFWTSGTEDPEKWSEEERLLRTVPDYVLEYAPYVHLYSGEEFWPCDIAEHLIHTTPHLNYTPLKASSDHPNLTNLDELNEWGRFVYLQSDDNVEERPEWLGGESNIPEAPGDSGDEDDDDDSGDYDPNDDLDDIDDDINDWWEVGKGDIRFRGGTRPDPAASRGPVPMDTNEGEELLDEADVYRRSLYKRLGRKAVGGRSDAPAVLIIVPKGNGVVDAFWFFFYSYNLGNTVFNVRFGNHVGDWEHTVVRFHEGKPKLVFFSEHSFGEAYSYEAVEKIGKRPVVYSATGTHAMYATPGVHSYVLPWGLLHDVTDRGPLWDPLLNSHSYTYDYVNGTLRSSNFTPKAPTNWFYFMGHWGDKFYPLSDPRQYRFAGQYHYVNGPLGPQFKNLGRKRICQGNGECHIRHWIGGSNRLRRWQGGGIGEEMSEEDQRRVLASRPEK